MIYNIVSITNHILLLLIKLVILFEYYLKDEEFKYEQYDQIIDPERILEK